MQRSTSVLTLLSILGACAYNPDSVSGETGADEATTAGTTGPGGSGTGVTATTGETVDTGPTTGPGSADATGPGPSDSSGPSEEGSTGAVACAGSCVAPAMGDWTGPFRLEISDLDDPVPDCGDGWDLALGTEFFAGIVAPPATCECSCGDAEGVSCTGATRILRRYPNPGCMGPATSMLALLPANCASWPAPGISNNYWQTDGDVPMPEGGSCLPAVSSSVEDAVFSTRYTLCGEGEPPEGACGEGGQCVNATQRPLCVMAEGDLECPGDGFEFKLVVSTGLTDTRGCSDCSCDDPEGTCSAAGSLLLNTGTCNVPAVGDFGVGGNSCPGAPGPIRSARYPESAAPEPTTSCTPSQPSPTGDVTGTGTTTLCCSG